MRIGVVGPDNSVREVEQAVAQAGLPVTPVPLSYHRYTEVPGILTEHQRSLDGVLFTGQIPFDYAMRYIQPERPWGYLLKDKLSLVISLLKAGFVKGYDITRVSVDNCEERMVYEAFQEVGYDREAISVVLSSHSLFSSTYLEDLIDFHIGCYRRGEAACCITGVDYIYRELSSRDIPCMMNSKAYDTIVQEVNRLLISRNLETSAADDFATLCIDIEFLEDHPVYSRNVIQLLHLKNRVKDLIYVFAQKVGASVFDVQGDHFYLCTKIGALLNETDELRRVEMFENILRIDLVKNVFIGVGVGLTAFQSQYHADLAKRHAKTFGSSSIFAVQGDRSIAGPMVAGGSSYEVTLDRDLSAIAQRTGIGIETLSRLDAVIRQYGVEFITPKRLAELYGVSLRNMHRLLAQLEQYGYAVEVGKEMQGGPGRPGRILQIKLDTT